LKFEALCLLTVLSGDSYYLRYWRREYDHFHPLSLPEEQPASGNDSEVLLLSSRRGITD